METSRLSNPLRQNDNDQVFYGILDHHYMTTYRDPESNKTQIRLTVGVIVFATTGDHNEAKFLLRKNIKQVVQDFENQLMSRLYS